MKKALSLLMICALMSSLLVGCASNTNNGIYYDGVPKNEHHVDETHKANTDSEEINDVAMRVDNTEKEVEKGVDEVEKEDDFPTLDEASKHELYYHIMSNDLVASFINGKELAKTGNPKIDAFLERFYEKAMDGDTYIQFMLELAEASGVDISVIDELIDYNASRRIGVYIDGLDELIKEYKEKANEQ